MTETVESTRHHASFRMAFERLRNMFPRNDAPEYRFECFECRHEFELGAPYQSHTICPNCGSDKVYTIDEPEPRLR